MGVVNKRRWDAVVQEANDLCNGLYDYGRYTTYIVVETDKYRSYRAVLEGRLTIKDLERVTAKPLHHLDMFAVLIRLLSMKTSMINRWTLINPHRQRRKCIDESDIPEVRRLGL